MNILLHACCAPCATWCIQRLKNEGNTITLFYDNPNIYPESERQKRLDNLQFLASYHHLPLIVEHTPHSLWLDYIKGFENEPEHGKRCQKCFELNLSLAQKALDKISSSTKSHFDGLTTSLTVSRYKDTNAVFSAAKNATKSFLEYNFKEQGGDAKSTLFSKELGLYRQKYCGCEFSLNY